MLLYNGYMFCIYYTFLYSDRVQTYLILYRIESNEIINYYMPFLVVIIYPINKISNLTKFFGLIFNWKQLNYYFAVEFINN